MSGVSVAEGSVVQRVLTPSDQAGVSDTILIIPIESEDERVECHHCIQHTYRLQHIHIMSHVCA